MTVANVSKASAYRLPPTMRAAQAAIELPEVQEMLRRLSAYRLGIFMPHKHDEVTGEFLPLPDGVLQVESGLAVSFQQIDDVARESEQFLPVGWVWRAGARSVAAACEMVSDVGPGDEEPTVKHKMLDEDRPRNPAPRSALPAA